MVGLICNNIDIVLMQEVCIHHENEKASFPIADFAGYLHNHNQKHLETKILWNTALLATTFLISYESFH